MRGKKSGLSGLSSILVARGSIAAFLVLSLLANLHGFTLVSGFLMFTFLLSLSSRIWGFSALKHVLVEIRGGKRRMFAGESADLHYTVTNGKLLPLIWLELLQDLPTNGCLLPDDSMERYEPSVQEAATLHPVFRKKIAFLMGFKKVSWVSRYTACRRGVYPVKNVTLRSGDGFGFTQSQAAVEITSFPVFVVYPRLVPVRTDPFYNTLWNCQSGPKGFFDDPTILRGSRPYRPTDSWKQINWRLAARQPELQVKLYETMVPRSVHFILDGASFAGLSEDNAEAEEALSVLASLVLRLEESGMQCGLSLPQTALSPAVNLFPGEADSPDILFHLAGYDAFTPLPLFDREGILSRRDSIGQVCFITYSGGRFQCGPLLDGLDDYAVTVFVCRDQEPSPVLSGLRTIPLLSLKGGDRR